MKVSKTIPRPVSSSFFLFFKRLGVGKISFGAGILKIQKACFDDIKHFCFDDIKRFRFRLIIRRAQALQLDDSRRMAFFVRMGTATGTSGNS
jgi:hypothetical protein